MMRSCELETSDQARAHMAGKGTRVISSDARAIIIQERGPYNLRHSCSSRRLLRRVHRGSWQRWNISLKVRSAKQTRSGLAEPSGRWG